MKCCQNERSKFKQPSSRLIRDGRRVPVFRPVPTILVPVQRSQADFITSMLLQSQAPVALPQ